MVSVQTGTDSPYETRATWGAGQNLKWRQMGDAQIGFVWPKPQSKIAIYQL
jgi:hypothetical protein